jgi:hypothetical protein
VCACTYYEHKGGKTGPGGCNSCCVIVWNTGLFLQGTRPIVRTLHFSLAKASGIFFFSQVLLPIKVSCSFHMIRWHSSTTSQTYFLCHSLLPSKKAREIAAKQSFFSIENLDLLGISPGKSTMKCGFYRKFNTCVHFCNSHVDLSCPLLDISLALCSIARDMVLALCVWNTNISSSPTTPPLPNPQLADLVLFCTGV